MKIIKVEWSSIVLWKTALYIFTKNYVVVARGITDLNKRGTALLYLKGNSKENQQNRLYIIIVIIRKTRRP